jgi:L-lactate dehydrogenase (cytochrome)
MHRVFAPLRPLVGVLDVPAGRRLAKAVNIADLRDCASRRAPRMVFDYIDGGADDEIALRRSRTAYAEQELHYSVLSGYGEADMRTKLFGHELGVPFFCCPTAGQKMFHREGERAAATVCAEHSTLFCLSALGTTAMDEVAEIHSGPKLLQLYLWKDRNILRDVLQRAHEAGFTALALTGDTSWFGNRERDPRNGFTVPPSYSPQQVWQAMRAPAWSLDFVSHPPMTFAVAGKDAPAESLSQFFNDMMAKDYSWRDAEWLLGEWNGKSALKGVCRAEDAQHAIATGFDAVWVSNHGGRQLETSPPTIELLPKIREAVGSDVELIVDGGVMRGTDVAKALAVGADAVGLGRAYLYGLAAGGTPGVRKAMSLMRVEVERAMGLLGVSSVEELRRRGPELVRARTRPRGPW